jgi:predicted aconitase
MKLTGEEKGMLDGAEGPAVAAAMDLLVRYGEALDCERLCDVRNVAGTMTQPSPAKIKLVREGGWNKAFAVINLDCDDDLEVPDVRVPTCQLQHGFGEDAGGLIPYPAENIRLQSDAEAFYGRRGVSILATCTPYQVGNIPVRGEHCAWMESSAVVYANSVLGAVVTRVPAVTDLDSDPCELIQTGDWVRIDADAGVVQVDPTRSRERS